MTLFLLADKKNSSAIKAQKLLESNFQKITQRSPKNNIIDLSKISEKEFAQRLKEDKSSKDSKILIFGGDGFLLHMAHLYQQFKIPFFGLNYGRVGFLLNNISTPRYQDIDTLLNTINIAEKSRIFFLKAQITDANKKKKTLFAMNEISLLREGAQAVHIEIVIDSITRIPALVSDGVVVSTPAGSTAYNYSLNGPIIHPDTKLLSICPVSPFRPRNWRGALVPDSSVVEFIIHNHEKRPISLMADFKSVKNITSVTITKDSKSYIDLLSVKELNLNEKILREQFANTN